MNSCKDQPGGDAHATNRPRLAEYFHVCREVALARGLRLVDHYPNWLKIMTDDPERFDRLLSDRIHPQLESYRQVLLPELKRALLGGETPKPVSPAVAKRLYRVSDVPTGCKPFATSASPKDHG